MIREAARNFKMGGTWMKEKQKKEGREWRVADDGKKTEVGRS